MVEALFQHIALNQTLLKEKYCHGTRILSLTLITCWNSNFTELFKWHQVTFNPVHNWTGLKCEKTLGVVNGLISQIWFPQQEPVQDKFFLISTKWQHQTLLKDYGWCVQGNQLWLCLVLLSCWKVNLRWLKA